MIEIQAGDKLIRKKLVTGRKRASLKLDNAVDFLMLSYGLEVRSCARGTRCHPSTGPGVILPLKLPQEGSVRLPGSLVTVPHTSTHVSQLPWSVKCHDFICKGLKKS